MKIFRHLFLGLVLVLMTFSSLTFVQADAVADITQQINKKNEEIKTAMANVDQLKTEFDNIFKESAPARNAACPGIAYGQSWGEEDNTCEKIVASSDDYEDEIPANYKDGLGGNLTIGETGNKRDYVTICDECKIAFGVFNTNIKDAKLAWNNAKNDLETKKIELSNLKRDLKNAEDLAEAGQGSGTNSLDGNDQYQTIVKYNNEVVGWYDSKCGKKINSLGQNALNLSSLITQAQESLQFSKDLSSQLGKAEDEHTAAKATYDAECSGEKETTGSTDEETNNQENPDQNVDGTDSINDPDNKENPSEQKAPPATQADADQAFSAYQREIERADEWMTATEGRRNYVPTKQLRDEINPILENASTAILAEDWKTATYNYNQVASKVLSANTRFLGRKYLELSDRNFDSVLVDNKIIHIGGNFEGQNEERVGKTFFTKILPMINRVIGVLGILYLLILGVKFILAQGDEEKMTKYKDQAVWLIVGLGLVSVAEFVGFDIFDPSQRDVLSDAAAKPFYAKLMQLVRFFEYVAMGLVLVNGIISGYKLITSGEEEETVSQEKKFLKSFIIGTIFILMAEVIVRVLAYQDENLQATQDILIQEVAGIINFLLTFIGGVAMLMLIFSSIYYVTSFGEEDQMSRAKRMILTSLGGVIIAFSAYTIAQFLINH